MNQDRMPVEITSKRGDAVLISLDDYRALEETAYLLRSPGELGPRWAGHVDRPLGQVPSDDPDGVSAVQRVVWVSASAKSTVREEESPSRERA